MIDRAEIGSRRRAMNTHRTIRFQKVPNRRTELNLTAPDAPPTRSSGHADETRSRAPFIYYSPRSYPTLIPPRLPYPVLHLVAAFAHPG